MSNAEEEELKPARVVPFSVIAGGRDGGSNWLKALPEGTVFLAKHSKNFPTTCPTSCLHMFKIDHNSTEVKAVRLELLNALSQTTGNFSWEDSADFSRQMECFEVLKLGGVEEET
jgi:hypothetical protein